MAACFKVDEARQTNSEENPTQAGLLTNTENNTSRSELVTPLGVSGETAGPDNLITEAPGPSGHCNPSDGGAAGTSEGSARPTTSQSLTSDKCKASTSRCGEKRPRESDSTSDVRVKRHLRPSNDSRAKEENIQDYDVKCAELWIEGELAVCEGYQRPTAVRRNQYLGNELQKQARAPLRPAPRIPVPKPVTQTLNDGPALRAKLEAGFRRMTEMLEQNEASQILHFSEMTTGLYGTRSSILRWTEVMSSFRQDQRVITETFGFLTERLNVIEKCVLDMHRIITERK